MLQYVKTLIPCFLAFSFLYFSSSSTSLLAWNFFLQLSIFIFLAGIPAYRTKRMSYVDIAWPFGLVGIGVLSLIFAKELSPRILCISGIYLIMGSRMGFGALLMWQKGAFKREFPRYQYQRLVWEKKGYTNETLVMQSEIFLQAAANCTFLAVPAFLQVTNSGKELTFLEISGYFLWLFSILFESLADLQKHQFIKLSANNKRKVCNVGLWKYSRHPNYFGEWMVWNSLVVSSLPSLFLIFQSSALLASLTFTASLFFIPKLMYQCLVYYTGARPSEYFSLQKRPEYKLYMESANQFFPWLRKTETGH